MIKAKTWNGKNLKGRWLVTRKLDGVRALSVQVASPTGFISVVRSRRNKPLYNLDRYLDYFSDAEVWLGDFKTTIQAVRTKNTAIHVPKMALYELDPPDRRLVIGTVVDPTAIAIRALLAKHKKKGEDGLILRQGDRWLKVKHVTTYDVRVTKVEPGKGKHKGRMGALHTTKGRVGTGFSDVFRTQCRHDERGRSTIVSKTIEVACNQLTPDGKFRHARFIRIRDDK